MKDLRNMTDYQISKALPPYRWLQIAIVWVVTGAALFFSGEIIALFVIGVAAKLMGLW